MYEYHIYSRLKKFAKAQKGFHMPGHKARGDFGVKFPVAPLDVTELSYSDNLHCPTGIIAAAQRDIAAILGARASFITTDGSSSGVLAMLYVAAAFGNKIIVQRNSHLSVWNACRLLNLEPVIVQGEEREGILMPPDPQDVQDIISNDPTVAGVLITSPDYYGNVAPLESYREITARYKKLLLVDGAHGAHLAFGDRKLYAGTYADMWVDGAHKTLPVLTQGALINVNNVRLVPLVKEALGIFRTTSPSYPVMASVEYGIKLMANKPSLIKKAIAAREAFVKDMPPVIRSTDDWTKLVIDFKLYAIDADRAAARLESNGIYCELSDGRYVLFYLSPMTCADELKRLNRQLKALFYNKNLAASYAERPPYPVAERTYSYLYALKRPCESVPLVDAIGRMCARNAGLTPPCIPVAVAGEIISAAAVKSLSSAKNTFGLTDGKIWVVKK